MLVEDSKCRIQLVRGDVYFVLPSCVGVVSRPANPPKLAGTNYHIDHIIDKRVDGETA